MTRQCPRGRNPSRSGPALTTSMSIDVVVEGGDSRLGTLGGDEVAVPGERRLRRPALGLEVDVHQPEALMKALAPLKVVHEGPDEVAAHVYARGHRRVQRPQVAVQVADPGLVVDRPV